MQLTINGKRPNNRFVKIFDRVKNREIKGAIAKLLHGNPEPLLLSAGLPIGRGMGEPTSTLVTRNLIDDLPAKHPVILELLSQTRKILLEIPKQDRDFLRDNFRKDPENDPINIAMHVCGYSCAPQLFQSIRKTAFYLINEPIFTKNNPPRESEIMFETPSIMMSFTDSRPQALLEYAKLLIDKRLGLPYSIWIPSMLRDKIGLEFCIELYRLTRGKEKFVLDGIARELSYLAMVDYAIGSRHIKGLGKRETLSVIRAISDSNARDAFLGMYDAAKQMG